MARLKRVPPPAPSFDRANFYVERIDSLLDDSFSELEQEEFENVLTDLGLILTQSMDGCAYRKRLKKRLTI
jgi:hypothetical protein